MTESGYYPPGAEYDPRAPWNQKDEETPDGLYALTPGQSICTCLPNPYKEENKEKEDNSQGKEKLCLIQNDSVFTDIVNIDNCTFEDKLCWS